MELNMKKNNKLKLLIIIGGVIVIIAIILIFIGVSKTQEKELTDISKSLIYDLEVTNSVNVCKKEKNCKRKQVNEYQKIILKDKSNIELNKVVEKINKDTEETYNLEITSTIDDSTCTKYKDIYNHKYTYTNNYILYENDNFISIAVDRREENLCTGKNVFKQIEAYIYDKESKKIITKDEFIKKIGLTEDDILKAINKGLENYSKQEKIDETYKKTTELNDEVLYYTHDGKIAVSFEIPNTNIYFQEFI